MAGWIEKRPAESKKFLAYLLAEVLATAVVIDLVLMARSDVVVIVAVVAKAFVTTGYVLGQAALDRFVRLAAIGRGLESDKPEPPK